MSLTTELEGAILEALQKAGDPGPIRESRHVGGGDINQAAQVLTPQGRYFLKWHRSPPSRFFECEARGLALLAGAGAVRAPAVLGYGSVPGSQTAFLILEWIERGSGGKDSAAAETLGRGLAQQHLLEQDRYGLDHDNYIGRLPQPNAPTDSWLAFYRDQRLGAQRDLARRLGYLPTKRERLLDQLMDSLSRWIDETQCRPSLLHGDLWGGNWMVAEGSEPVMIDPAVYIGDREADLAMTALFGGFPSTFYAAYREAFPLAPGYEERQPLYKLYYLLCHLNLFGEGYGGSVDGILQRYVR